MALLRTAARTVFRDTPDTRAISLIGRGSLLRHADMATDRPVPQASIEFEVPAAAATAVAPAAQELVDRGYTLLHETRTEPWGQTVARLQSPEGLVVGLSYTPWMHYTVLS